MRSSAPFILATIGQLGLALIVEFTKLVVFTQPVF
ncbi:hypothetical protein B0G77_3907 [Paraburkholderia sp. BL10I2N1]|nr:hypothetical protein B0G77_3907 [Paraburkholderia sp. BL10I2N1]